MGVDESDDRLQVGGNRRVRFKIPSLTSDKERRQRSTPFCDLTQIPMYWGGNNSKPVNEIAWAIERQCGPRKNKNIRQDYSRGISKKDGVYDGDGRDKKLMNRRSEDFLSTDKLKRLRRKGVQNQSDYKIKLFFEREILTDGQLELLRLAMGTRQHKTLDDNASEKKSERYEKNRRPLTTSTDSVKSDKWSTRPAMGTTREKLYRRRWYIKEMNQNVKSPNDTKV